MRVWGNYVRKDLMYKQILKLRFVNENDSMICLKICGHYLVKVKLFNELMDNKYSCLRNNINLKFFFFFGMLLFTSLWETNQIPVI